jgi:hypothetical protein
LGVGVETQTIREADPTAMNHPEVFDEIDYLLSCSLLDDYWTTPCRDRDDFASPNFPMITERSVVYDANPAIPQAQIEPLAAQHQLQDRASQSHGDDYSQLVDQEIQQAESQIAMLKSQLIAAEKELHQLRKRRHEIEQPQMQQQHEGSHIVVQVNSPFDCVYVGEKQSIPFKLEGFIWVLFGFDLSLPLFRIVFHCFDSCVHDPSIHPPIHPSIHPSIHPPIHPPIRSKVFIECDRTSSFKESRSAVQAVHTANELSSISKACHRFNNQWRSIDRVGLYEARLL